MSTKAQKLTACVAIVVPAGAIGESSRSANYLRWMQFKRDVALIAGGFTVTEGNGGYVFQQGERAGELVEETVFRLETRVPAGTVDTKGKQLLGVFKDYLAFLLDVAGEEAVYIELPGSDGGAYIAYKESEPDSILIEGGKDA